MKNPILLLLLVVLLSGMALNAHAAFVIKEHSKLIAAPAQKINHGGNALVVSEQQTIFPAVAPYGGGGEARRAFFWAMWGLFIAPLGILAIIHGVRALKKSRGGRYDDIAGLSIVIGSLEVLATVIAIIFFFVFIV